MIRLNEEHHKLLSNDISAIAGLMFDVGSGRYAAPRRLDDVTAVSAREPELQRVREELAATQKRWAAERKSDATHTEIQGWLRALGLSLGFDAWIAANDRSRRYGEGSLATSVSRNSPRV